MKVLVSLVFLIAVTQCKVIGSYESEGGNEGYEAMTSGYESGYESTGSEYETKCTPYYETVHMERCEDYEDKVCYTSQQESCQDVVGENCRAIIASRQVRQCMNVTELLCGLKETIQYDIVQAVFTVQKCHKVTERVCDTVYEPQMTAKDDFQCIVLKAPKCYAEDRTVVDKTCRTTTTFDCGHVTAAAMEHNHGDAYGSSGDAYGSSADSYGSSEAGGYGASSDDYGKSSGYGYEEEAKCKRSHETKCYTTPRTVTSQKCDVREEKVCEKLSEKVPFPAEKQVCHDEEKKVCELEQRQQPKQIKKYVYTKQCRSVPRRVCENADVKELVPSCVPTMRKQCHYTPVEKCEQVPKSYCYKVPKKVTKQKCETVKKPAYGDSYDSKPETGYSSDYSS